MKMTASTKQPTPPTRSASRRGATAGAKGIALFPPIYGRETAASQPMQKIAEASSHGPAIQPMHHAGLPQTLQRSIESLSGLPMDDVQVHYNSTKPALMQALASTQGEEIHLGPGQERHLPHEAWHVVQQKQGRVQPTLHAMGVAINDDRTLEKEATLMGDEASRVRPGHVPGPEPSAAGAVKKHRLYPRVMQRVTAPSYTNASITGVYNGNVSFTEQKNTVLARSPALNLTGTVDITAGEPASQNTGIEVGFVQTLVESSGTAKYQAHAGKEERAQLALNPQPIRDGTAGETPWYEQDDAVSWNGADIVGLTTTLYDRPQTPFPRYGNEDGQEIYSIVGQDKFKTWLIAWKDGSAKYLRWYTWTVNFSGTKAGGVWTAAGASTNTGNGSGVGRDPGSAKLGDPVANDSLSWRWRKV